LRARGLVNRALQSLGLVLGASGLHAMMRGITA